MLPQSEQSKRVSQFITELLFYSFLIFVFFIAADRLKDAAGFRQPSVIMFVFHSIFLYIHEGGHFLFSAFGRTLHILGGSFWQVIFPLLSFVFAIRERSRIAPFPLFLTGFNLMDVSLYMRDAVLRQLPLLGGDKGRHDWWNLFRDWGMLDSADLIADCVYYLGIVVCVVSIAAGLAMAFYSFFKPKIPADDSTKTLLNRLINNS